MALCFVRRSLIITLPGKAEDKLVNEVNEGSGDEECPAPEEQPAEKKEETESLFASLYKCRPLTFVTNKL